MARCCQPFKLMLVYNSTSQIAGRIFATTNLSAISAAITGPLAGCNFRELWLPRRILRHGRRGVVQCYLFMEQLTTAQTGNRMILRFHTCNITESAILSLNTSSNPRETLMTVMPRWKSYRCGREEFLATIEGLEQDEANVRQFNVQKYVYCRMGTSCGRSGHRR